MWNKQLTAKIYSANAITVATRHLLHRRLKWNFSLMVFMTGELLPVLLCFDFIALLLVVLWKKCTIALWEWGEGLGTREKGNRHTEGGAGQNLGLERSAVSTNWPSTLTSEVSNILLSRVWKLYSVLTLFLLKTHPEGLISLVNLHGVGKQEWTRGSYPLRFTYPRKQTETGSKFRNNSMKHMSYNPIDLELLWSGYHFLKITIGLKELMDLVKASYKGLSWGVHGNSMSVPLLQNSLQKDVEKRQLDGEWTHDV